MKTSTLHDAVSVALFAVVAAGMAAPATAMERPPVAVPQTAAGKVAPQASFDFDIPAGDLGTALNDLSSQSGIEVLYPADAMAGKQAGALRGHMPWPEALATLLRGSGYGYRRAADGSVVIEGAAAPASPGATTLGTVVVTGTRIRGGTSASPVITIDSEDTSPSKASPISEK